jgi:hypothetical protein
VAIHGYVCLSKDYWPVKDKYIRLWDIGLDWAHMNPARGVYDFSVLEAVLSAHPGTNFMLTLSGTPQWAATNPAETGWASWIGPASNSPPKDLVDWDNFLVAVVTAARGRISSYQIWNEPTAVPFWKDIATIDRLGVMTLRAKTIIKARAPKASIVSAPVLPRNSTLGVPGMNRGSKYLQALKHYDWPVDIHTAHIYPEIGFMPARWRYYVQDWKDELKRLAAPNCPLWVTETTYNLLGGAMPDAAIAQRIPATDQAANDLSVARVYWYAYGVHGDPSVLGIPFQSTGAGTTTLAKFQ